MKKKIKLVINKASSFVAPLFNQPKKHLKTWLVIFLALTAGLAVLFFLFSPRATEAAWWDETWLYRKAVQISNSNGADLTDFQVAITLDTVSLITAGKMQDDCDDLRITDGNGNIIPHWIEENNPGCNNSATKIWTKVPTVFDGTDATTIYAYYGNSQAENAENGDNVFEFFDDFSGSSLDMTKWDVINSETGTHTVESGLLAISSTGDWWGTSDSSRFIISKNNLGSTFISEALINQIGSENFNRFFGLRSSSATNSRMFVFLQDNDRSHITNVYRESDGISAGYYGDNTGVINTGNNKVTKIIKNGDTITGYYDSSQTNSRTVAGWNLQKIGLTDTHGSGSSKFDWVFVRQYASSEPTAGTPAAEETSAGPVAYWKFDEGTGTTAHDSSGQGNDGTLVNGPTWQTEDMCISGKCLGFDGTTAKVDLGSSPTFNITDDTTISVWLKTTQSKSYRGIVGRASGSKGWIIENHEGKIRSWLDNSIIDSNRSINDGAWHHIVITLDYGNEREIYIDGQIDTSAPAPVITNSTTNAYIGSWGSDSYLYEGLIDEVKIYPYVRTEEQIKSDYIAGASLKGSSAVFGHKTETAPITPLASKLVAYWKFDEGYETTAHNSVASGADATILGADWNVDGKTGKALYFNGTASDYAYATQSDGVLNSASNSFTLSAWVKLENDSGGLDYIIGKKGFHGGLLTDGSSRIKFTIVNGSNVYYHANFDNPSLNRWYHVVGVFDRIDNSMKLYVDGNLKDTNTLEGNIRGYNNIWRIGGEGNASSWNFKGLIDEVKIYNAALTPEEILQDYNQGMAAVMGQSSANTGSTIPGGSAAQEYCVPGSTDTCRPPVAEWNFEENTDTTARDTSGNGNDGTLVNMDNSNWVVGVNGSGAALSFDGNGEAVTTNTPAPSLPFTIQFWAKPSSSSPVGMFDSAPSITNVVRNYPAGKVEWWNQTPSINLNATANQWTFFSFIFRWSSNTRFIDYYKNGIFQTTASASGNSTVGWSTLNFGTINNGTTGKYSGLLDDIRIYNYARTPAQIAWDYNRGGPVGHWRFDECQGTVAHDVSGNDNHGTINIGATAPQTAVGTCQIPGTAWGNGAAGKLNSAMSFDGVDDWVDVGNSTYLKFGTGDFTLATWFKIPASQTSSFPVLISKGTYNTVGGYIFYIVENKFRVYLDNKGPVNGLTNLNDNQWHHGVVTKSGNAITLYLNGKVDNIGIITDVNIISDLNVRIGARIQAGSEQYLNGLIDDVQIFNYALTPLQIKTLYNDGAVRFGE